jgi:hypothetical protein
MIRKGESTLCTEVKRPYYYYYLYISPIKTKQTENLDSAKPGKRSDELPGKLQFGSLLFISQRPEQDWGRQAGSLRHCKNEAVPGPAMLQRVLQPTS